MAGIDSHIMEVNSNKQCMKVFDISPLKSHEVINNFSIGLKNRFAALPDLENETAETWAKIEVSGKAKEVLNATSSRQVN